MKRILAIITLLALTAPAQTVSVGQALTYLNSGIQARIDWEASHNVATNAHNARFANLTTYQTVPYAANITVDLASSVTKKVKISADGDMTMGCTNGVDGSSVKWRVYANGADVNVTWPDTLFKIPSSSLMPYSNVVSNGTYSIFFTEYNADSGKWLIQSYVWGY